MVSGPALITSSKIAFSSWFNAADARASAPFNRDSSGVSVVFSCSTMAYLVSNVVNLKKKHGGGKTGLVCTMVLGLTFLLLGPAPYVSSVPQQTIVLCVLMVFLGFSVGGVTVPVETLMMKLVVCYYTVVGDQYKCRTFPALS